MGKQRFEYTDEAKRYLNEYSHSLWQPEDYNTNLFSKDEMGNDEVWKRIQFGWEVGLSVYFANSLYCGASYGTDFSEITQDVKIHTVSVTLGYTF